MTYLVTADYGSHYQVVGETDQLLVQAKTVERPCVGDWVTLERQFDQVWITSIVERSTRLIRKIAGTQMKEQLLAVNFDAVFIFYPATKELNVSYLERLMIAAWDSGARPYLILSKADLAEDLGVVNQLSQAFPGVSVHALSSVTGLGLEKLLQEFEATNTVVLLGSSGVGKSSFINALRPDTMKTQAVRSDQKGRHTTTHRELIMTERLRVIDTPGVREFGLGQSSDGISYYFSDVEELSQACRFRNCLHEGEPGCAVQQALDLGQLATERLEAYRKYQKEAKYLEKKLKEKAKTTKPRRF